MPCEDSLPRGAPDGRAPPKRGYRWFLYGNRAAPFHKIPNISRYHFPQLYLTELGQSDWDA
jgi:hypothetical protein